MNHAHYCKQFLPAGGLVLDIGSGRGHFLCDMAKLGFQAHGVETNAEYIRLANQLAEESGVKIFIAQSRGEHLPYSDNYFDFVNCAEVTEHVDDPDKLCREIFRVLKPGGKGYVSFHNRWGVYDYHYHLPFINWLPRFWTEPVLKIINKQKADSPAIGKQKLVTMHYFTYRAVMKKLSNIGFAVEDIREKKIKSKFFWPTPLLSLYYFLLRPFYLNTFHILITKS
jgi:ubiquinone/menaquinone biosynthesis C-methylase UbiE